MVGMSESQVDSSCKLVFDAVRDVVQSLYVPFFGGSNVDMRGLNHVTDMTLDVFGMGSSGTAWRLPVGVERLSLVIPPDCVNSFTAWRYGNIGMLQGVLSKLRPKNYAALPDVKGGGGGIAPLRHLREIRIVVCEEHLSLLRQPQGWGKIVQSFQDECETVGIRVVFAELDGNQHRLDVAYPLWPVWKDKSATHIGSSPRGRGQAQHGISGCDM